jgi:[ribosomal protein S5]-alanine N-acetyltransferase
MRRTLFGAAHVISDLARGNQVDARRAPGRAAARARLQAAVATMKRRSTRTGRRADAIRMTIVVETARLRIREMVPGDLDFVATMLADADVSRYYERRFSRADAQVWLDRQLARYARDGHGLWLLESRQTGEPLGQAGLAIQQVEGERHPEIGWLLHRPWWGHGYATEAGAAARDLAFERWRYRYVISLIRPENARSRAVAERLGMQPGREVTFHGFKHLVYSIRSPQR